MGNTQSERDKNEAEFGKQIYEIVQQIYPENTENITGMLLELEHQELERLLTKTNHEELYVRIHQAAKNMPSSDIPEREEEAKNNSTGQTKNGCEKHHHSSNTENLLSKKLEDRNTAAKMFTVDDNDIDIKVVLGEKIYSLIENQHPNDAEKLTGILLEMDNQSLEQLIKDTDLLKKKIEEVLSVLQSHTEQMQNGERESAELKQIDDKTAVAEELYEMVYALDSEQADKLTGMLLEMDVQDLKELVKNQAALEEKLNQASAALNNQLKEEVKNVEEEDKTLVGEQLYYLISEWYPEQADKITGMLLELDITTLNLLIKDSVALKEKATHAANALDNTNSDKEIPHDLTSTSNSVEAGSRDQMLSVSSTDSELKTALAEQLYNIVEKWYPVEAAKLTGMLMDIDCVMLKGLLLNEQLLREKLEGALAALQRTKQTIPPRESANGHNKEGVTKKELGGKLYEKVEELHPEDADKITGMLLEMSVEDIQRILTNSQELEEKIELAENALS